MRYLGRSDIEKSFTIVQDNGPNRFGASRVVQSNENASLHVMKTFTIAEFPPMFVQPFCEHIERLSSIRSRYILPYDVISIDADEITVMRHYIDGMPLSDVLQRKEPINVQDVWIQILQAYHQLHSEGLNTLSIKPSNIFLLDDGQIMITDAYKLPINASSTIKHPDPANYLFLAPEFFLDPNTVGPSSDVWSLGTILLILLGEPLPWNTKNVCAMLKQFSTGDYTLSPTIPLQYKNLLSSILVIDPEKRCTISQLLMRRPLSESYTKIYGTQSTKLSRSRNLKDRPYISAVSTLISPSLSVREHSRHSFKSIQPIYVPKRSLAQRIHPPKY